VLAPAPNIIPENAQTPKNPVRSDHMTDSCPNPTHFGTPLALKGFKGTDF